MSLKPQIVEFVFEIERGDYENYKVIPLNIKGKAHLTPGNYYGPPENCFPDEFDIQLIEAVYNGEDYSDQLKDFEYDSILENIVDKTYGC